METNNQKPIIWIGTSLDDLKRFPVDVRKEVGFALHRVEQGNSHKNIKPLKGYEGVYEIRISFMGDAYRNRN